ncbi:hypothetical protein V1281_000320 [Nitrobacteraceae bacterium AZCC 2161]
MTAPKKNLTVFTSLPPTTKRVVNGEDFGISYQRACISSWIDAGFDVVSLNPAHEIELLKEFNFPVSFIESSERRPTIAELLKAANNAATDAVGFINADCYLLNYSEFVDAIVASAKEGLVMVERVNINPETLLPSGRTCLGFDAFFFAKSDAINVSVDADLAVGQPWWDYWLPVEFALIGKRLLRLKSPIIFHLDHEQGWSQERWLSFGKKLISRLAHANVTRNPMFAADLQKFSSQAALDQDDLGGFGDWCFNWLRDNATIVPLSSDKSAGDLFSRILRSLTAFDGMHEATLALAKANNDVAAVKAYADDNIVLKEAHRSAEIHVRHLEAEVAALREGHQTAERYARHLEVETAALREAHKSAEAYAKHLEKDSVALRDTLSSLNSAIADLYEAHRSAERHSAFQGEEISRLNEVIQGTSGLPIGSGYRARALLERYWKGATRRMKFH